MNIYLAGMIGAGKTTVGRALADHLGWPFADLDAAMEVAAGKTFHQVVAEEGWLGFRQWEYRICKGFARLNWSVVALGGGTVRYQWNRDVLEGSGVNVLLACDLNAIADRVRDNDRPRVNPGVTLEEDLRTIWDEHQQEYLAWANLVYPTDRGKQPTEEAVEIAALAAPLLGCTASSHRPRPRAL